MLFIPFFKLERLFRPKLTFKFGSLSLSLSLSWNETDFDLTISLERKAWRAEKCFLECFFAFFDEPKNGALAEGGDNILYHFECDQIGHFWKILAKKISMETSTNFWWPFDANLKMALFVKKFWAIFNCNI